MARRDVLRHLDGTADLMRRFGSAARRYAALHAANASGYPPTFSEYSASVTCSIQVT
jgi:hypothetical protein